MNRQLEGLSVILKCSPITCIEAAGTTNCKAFLAAPIVADHCCKSCDISDGQLAGISSQR
jgi:hypothetical protein